jgi:hypothetical protein
MVKADGLNCDQVDRLADRAGQKAGEWITARAGVVTVVGCVIGWQGICETI